MAGLHVTWVFMLTQPCPEHRHTKTIKITLLIVPTLYPNYAQCPHYGKICITKTNMSSRPIVGTQNTSIRKSPILIWEKIFTSYVFMYRLIDLLIGN